MSAHIGDPQHPAIAVGTAVGERVGALRKRRGWQQRELADELVKLGWEHVDRTVVAKIETGTRKVSLENLLALAAALGVEPVALLLPRDDQVEVALTPNLLAPAWVIRAWIHGYMPLGNYALPTDRVEADRFYAESISDQEWRARQYPLVNALRNHYISLEIAAAQADNNAMQAILRSIVNDAQSLLEGLQYDTTKE
ncbi:MAG: helix-turn-helix domain-containing protein [bacterium]